MTSLSLSFIVCKVKIIIHPLCWVGVRVRDNVGKLFVVGKHLPQSRCSINGSEVLELNSKQLYES